MFSFLLSILFSSATIKVLRSFSYNIVVQLTHLEDGVDVNEPVVVVFFASEEDDNVIVTHICLYFVVCSLLFVLWWAYNLLAGTSMGKWNTEMCVCKMCLL